MDAAAKPRRVFISYAHGSDEHADQVRRLWHFLRHNGIDARLDRSAAAERQDWALWMADEIRQADHVLVMASATYRERAEGRSGPAAGRGVQWEARLIRDAFYAAPDALDRFVPVVLPDESVAGVPDFLAPATCTVYRVNDFTVAGAEDLLRLLLRQPAEPEPALGAPPLLPPRRLPPHQQRAGGAEQHIVASGAGSSAYGAMFGDVIHHDTYDTAEEHDPRPPGERA